MPANDQNKVFGAVLIDLSKAFDCSSTEIIFTWLPINQMVGNANKCQLITNQKNNLLSLKIGNDRLVNRETVKVLGITFDNHLTFKTHVRQLCKIANQKVGALNRLSPFLSTTKKRLLMNAFFKCQFSYCPLIWMFHSMHLENKINRLQERCLKIVYTDTYSTFEDLLVFDGSIKFHERALQLLAIELFKVASCQASNVLKEIFPQNESNFNTRKKMFFKSRAVRSEAHGRDSLAFLGPKIWELLPNSLKCLTDLMLFKFKIKFWRPSACPCRNCQKYIHRIGLNVIKHTYIIRILFCM